MTKYPYKAIENSWGEVFIIRMGIRRTELGGFNYLAEAQEKCDELNKDDDNDYIHIKNR